MIRSFSCRETEKIWNGKSSRQFPNNIQNRALRKLRLIDASQTLDDLRNPPGNRLENLAGNRRGQKSIRINDQWRICFVWRNNEAHDVEIVDYH
ncbi:MAG: type II toxin-antitoxin system RelE/ParE family toxin [Alphaproteobacteria bacterium]|nr:type II toxin-antitoxin system RelE/ParE family toxin [Alphaproteobacteria bacterium]